MSNGERLPPLEMNLLSALKALDTQIAREMQRSPAEREEHGVMKREPYLKRIEKLTGFVLDAVGAEEADLDGVLVLSQTLAKSLQMLVEDMGPEGLGKVRSSYCHEAFDCLERAVEQGRRALKGEHSELT